jgi:hypothetical protein
MHAELIIKVFPKDPPRIIRFEIPTRGVLKICDGVHIRAIEEAGRCRYCSKPPMNCECSEIAHKAGRAGGRGRKNARGKKK